MPGGSDAAVRYDLPRRLPRYEITINGLGYAVCSQQKQSREIIGITRNRRPDFDP